MLHVQRPDIFLPVIDQAPGVITSIDTGDISIAEIKRVIHRLKNVKSPRVTESSATLIDIILTSHENLIIDT